MEFTQYSRRPFDIEAVEITEENFDEVFEMIGKEIRTNGEGVRSIIVDRRIVPSVNRAFVGWWVTRMGDNIRCYPPKIFEEGFMPKENKAAKIIFVDELRYGD